MKKGMSKSIFKRIITAVMASALIFTSVPYYNTQADVLVPANPDNSTQTGYKTVLTFLAAKWNNILQNVFKTKSEDPDVVSVSPVTLKSNDTEISSIPIPSSDNIINNKIQVKDDSTYFNWDNDLNDSVIPWTGTYEGNTVESDTETITYEADSVSKGANGSTITAPAVSVEYTVYNVSTADELAIAMAAANDEDAPENVKINLLNDIDLNGQEQCWQSEYVEVDYKRNGWFYIEGNGYTIYNMKTTSLKNNNSTSGAGTASFLGTIGNHDENGAYDRGCKKKVVIKNLNFSNCLVFSNASYTSVVISLNRGQLYMENVNINDSFVYSSKGQTGTLMGRNQQCTGDVFIRNCSSQNCYVFGTMHSGGLTGCQHNTGTNYKVKYDEAFPDSPEVWMDRDHTNTNYQVYPEMIENCYSVDCELYSLDMLGDSGGLLSCGGKLICRNCFTNNIVYGAKKTGAFFGRIVTTDSGGSGLYDDAGKKRVEIYFENCYASGSIEGTSKIGGFVGFEDGSDNAAFGVAVYRNCYTTAMVGMDYAGSQLGGFIGHENTGSNQKATINVGVDEDGNTITNSNSGSVYINCYAAGEVGNILSDTSVEQTGDYDYIGGFLGLAGFYGSGGIGTYSSGGNNGNYINCYYDMQTTAMRERAAGKSDQFAQLGADASQIPGVTGVYTEHSDKKDVAGLTDTVDMGDDSVWKNVTEAYPMLNCFADSEQVDNNFGKNAFVNKDDYDEDTQERIESRLEDKAEIVLKYSAASASTVLLSHWDSTMNMDTGTIDDETNWKPGLPINKLTKQDYASDDANKWDGDDDGQYWEINYTNLAAGTYEFKIQAGTSWVYNFGKEKAGGANCSLTVPQDSNVKIKFDYIANVSETEENTNFRIWAELYNSEGTLYEVQELGINENEEVQNLWTIAGSFSAINSNAEWNPAYEAFDMQYTGDGIYTMTSVIPAGSYQFKVTKDHDWATSYGVGGSEGGTNNNMEFTVSEECQVTFVFDEETHLTTVTAEPDSALTYVKTDTESIDFTGYSLIAPKTVTGHEWLDGIEAAQAGEMTDEDGDGRYEVRFTVSRYDEDENSNFDKTYGYKVIENAVDIGPNNYFLLHDPSDDTINEIELTFIYNSVTGEASVKCDENPELVENAPTVDNYGVLGSMSLTGLNWGKDSSDTEVADAGKMSVDENGIWSITFYDVEAGTHSFKVVGNCSFSSGIDYGAYDGSSNYEVTTNAIADITIEFNEESKSITVTSNPSDAIVKDRYVVSGNTNLTGENWKTDSTENEMEYDEYTGTFTKTYDNLVSDENKNYVFKVVKFGLDNKSENLSFCIAGEEDETYKLVITYYPKTKKTEYNLYASDGNKVNEYIKAPDIQFYSVIGDEDLTGYNWLGENNVDQEAAALKGKMTDNGDGTFSVTFNDVYVGTAAISVGFKVVANGTWDSGISYGNSNGGNYSVSLASDSVYKCDVTITFDETTHEITVTANPDCIVEIDESQFEWFVAGDYRLVSYDQNRAPVTVYDTVRDITFKFNFTSNSETAWENDNGSGSRNEESGFYSHLGKADDQGFDLEYTVDGKNVTGTFNEPIIELETSEVTDDEGVILYTQYSCSRFMPGKQWLTVTTGDEDDEIKGTRNLRLIPTAYLEAGNDADINVLQSGSDYLKENIKNIVTYRENSTDGVTFTGLTDGDGKKAFSYYNFALTAGYAITDRSGLGYYGNYSNQNVVNYDADILRENVPNADNSNEYYTMTSVFTQNASYSDTDVEEGASTNLIVDELADQSLIGSSYNDGENYAKTIVKVYKKVEDENGVLEADGKKYSYPKVFMDSSEDSSSEYHTNYLKWTGQLPFDSEDEGTYIVTYFWSLSDGRFLTDNKHVYINASTSQIEKTVDKSYIENSDDTDNCTLKYTVTYTSNIEGDFTICDILPFDGDSRYNNDEEDFVISSVMNNSSFTLKNIEIQSEIVESEDQENPVNLSEITSYYTQDEEVRTYLTVDSDGIPDSDVASKADVTQSCWTTIQSGSADVEDVVALVAKGTQINAGTVKITITYTVEVNDVSSKEKYVNNAFYSVIHNSDKYDESGSVVNGFSKPATTVVVSRELSGYVWFDSNLNGKFNSNEPAIYGVTVTLMKKNDSGIYETTGITAVTDENGYYEFPDINYSGNDYQVQFSAPGTDDTSSGDVIIKYSDLDGNDEDRVINFDDLNLSKRLSQYQVTDKAESRNIAELIGDADTNKTYSIDEILPNAEDIIKNNNQRRYSFGSIQNYYFTREFQNLGLSNADMERTCSLEINKVDDDTKEPLENVIFKLEYRLSGDEYIPVTYTIDSDGNYVFTESDDAVLEALAVATDENGKIKFINLPATAEYRLTEVSACDGYNVLDSEIEFNLPYYIEDGNVSGYVTGNDEEPVDGVYYYDVTFTITNSAIPNLPATGGFVKYIPIVIAALLIASGVAVYEVYISRKKKNKKITE